MKKLVSLSLSKGLILLLILSIFACSTRKAEVHKKEESVSVLQQNEIQKTEFEKIKADVLKISKRQDIKLSPRDPDKEMRVVYGNDTLIATNADINISTRQEKEKDKSKTEREIRESDQSSTHIEHTKQRKNKATERQSASWGLNLGIIFGIIVLIIGGYLYLKTR
jgi:outer membrane lipoprotein-sorting protein